MSTQDLLDPVVRLLAALDLSRSDLSGVRAAWECGDPATASAAFAAHLRTRPQPRWFFDPSEPPRNIDDRTWAMADRALAHTFIREGIPHTFGPHIDWSHNPTGQPDGRYPLNNEWTWQLSRHWEWSALARAFSATGDIRYARELAAQIPAWIRENPPPDTGSADQGPDSRWRTIECGLRMQGAWPDVFFHLLRRPDVFPDDVLLTLVEGMRRHAEYLDAHPTSGNWLFMEANGLFHVGVLFPEFRNAECWRKNALDRLERELEIQVYPDGVQYELTPHYHNVTVENAVAVLRLARQNDIPVSERYLAQIEKMYALNLWAMPPDRDVPPLNDSGHINVRTRLAEASVLFPERADFRYIATEGAEGAPPSKTSHLFPYAGWAVMRSGWDRNALYLLLDAGPFGYSHQHEDKLSFVLHAYGARLVYDPGSYAYEASAMRDYIVSARAHNVAHIDGKEQRRGGVGGSPETRRAYLSEQPVMIDWRMTSDFDYAAASYGSEPIETWGPDRKRIAVHTRRILFDKHNRLFVLCDSFLPANTANHLYETVFHLDAPAVWLDPKTHTIYTQSPEQANLAILTLPAAAGKVRIAFGEKEPHLLGWIPRVADGLYSAEPRPAVCYTRRDAGPTHHLYVFAPYPPGSDTPPVCAVAANTGGDRVALSAAISLTDGAVTHFLLTKDGQIRYERL